MKHNNKPIYRIFFEGNLITYYLVFESLWDKYPGEKFITFIDAKKR